MKIIFVCTGNTCRSPMAAALFLEALRRRQLDHCHVQVSSAGVIALPDQPASPQAAAVMAARGLSLADHRSRRLSPAMIEAADLLLCMTEEHTHGILMMDAAAAGRVFTLGEFVFGRDSDERIPDPFGQATTVYEKTADRLAILMEALVDKLMEERMVACP